MTLEEEIQRFSSDLSTQLKTFLVEAESPEEPSKSHTFVVYSGDFEPFHVGNYLIYKALQEYFGDANVFITTNDSTLSFNAKKKMMMEMFDIPDDRIEPTKHLLIPTDVLKKFSTKDDAYVLAIPANAVPLIKKMPYYNEFHTQEGLQPFGQQGYYVVTPPVREHPEGNASAKQLLQVLQSDKASDAVKGKAFQKLYGKDDKQAMHKFMGTLDRESGAGGGKTDAKSSDGKGDMDKKDDSKRKKAKNPKAGNSSHVPPMQQKIRNPKTGRMIKVASAKKYPRDQPAYKAATALTQQAGVARPTRKNAEDLRIAKIYAQWAKKNRK